MILNHARLPIPTLPQGRRRTALRGTLKPKLYAPSPQGHRRTALRGTLKPKLYAPSARAVHAEQGVEPVSDY